MSPQERSQLIDAMLNDDICEADFLRIEAELTVDPDARREYYDRLSLTALLETVAGHETVASVSNSRSIQNRKRRLKWVAVAICGIVVVITAWSLKSDSTQPQVVNNEQSDESSSRRANQTASEAQASGFGVIAGQSNAAWMDAADRPDGSLLPAGSLQLMSGLVQLELFSGVTVVVEGAAEFSVLSSMDMSVTAGKVRAHVPQAASGFRIRTPDGDVVDLGTEFAIDASEAHTDVHVLEGEVEWHDESQGFLRLEKGDGLRRSANQTPQPIPVSVGHFISDVDLREQISRDRKNRRERWAKSSTIKPHDLRLLAWYRTGIADLSSRRVMNQSVGSNEVASEGAIIAADRSSDRWGVADGAVDFSPTGSRMRMVVPGEHRSLTLLCWVRINSLDRWYNSLFLTDGHDLHEPHWQIMDDGRLFFSVKKRDQWDRTKGEKDKHVFYSPPFWNASLSGKWLMIATVYDVDSVTVSHYLNGQQLSREAIPTEYLVESIVVGNASLGNWGMPERDDPKFAVRNLNGSMDEFALFGAALTSDEIGKFYEDGKP